MVEGLTNVFITGATGFIGAALATHYRAAGAEVRGMDLRADSHAGVVAGDVSTAGPWQEHAAGCDVVIHTAAIVSMRLEGARGVWEANVLGTRNALDAAQRGGASRFIHLSSVTVFGFDFPDGVNESYPVRPSGVPYIDTKIASEQVVLQAHAEGRVPVTVIRPGDVYGPGSRPWAVLPLRELRARRFTLPRRGRGIFSPIYIEDLVAGIAAAAETPAAAGQVITLADGVGVENREFFRAYAELLGRRRVPTAPTPVAMAAAAVVQRALRFRPGDVDVNPMAVRYMNRRGTYSNAKARELLGWEPKVGVAEGLRRTCDWLTETGYA